ncbi:zinc-binding dehydrogenase [Leifsonia sp. ZF2019]|uniref:zinc-binding dehydrogenase n=1 Tax=Leifsonia sp. ZF2019 TaxID=2781978 RepID=UPI001CBDB8E1|nr:zinc-binding dehydrogenase [Leifsonia sp. ZF2019]UAJ78271.1 zinc-binding dehydrogenase [Leifsonia sp. ZF2019]
MRAVVIREFGDASGMAVVETASPSPSAGQVLVRTDAIGVGGVDAVIRRGTLGGLGFETGLVLGSEVAGTVAAVGDGVDDSWVGRRVWAFTGTSGAYADEAVAAVEDVVPLPAELSPIDAVALGSAAPVARFALAHAHLAPGETVLVRGAAGSIGIAAVELAARAGASAVAVTTSSAERGARLLGLGATHVLDRRGGGDPTAPAAYDVIVDIVGGEHLPDFLDVLAPNGRLVLVGAVAGFPLPDFGMALLRAFRASRSFATFSLDSIEREALRTVRAETFDDAVRGDLHAVVDDVLPLSEAAAAHARLDRSPVFGRLVLTP